MRMTLKSLAGVAALGLATHAAAQITLYQNEGFRGPVFAADRPIAQLRPDSASTIAPHRPWSSEEPGRYVRTRVSRDDALFCALAITRRFLAMGMNDRISSVRPVSGKGYVYAPPPAPVPVYEYRQRPNERLYQVPVTYVRAVVGPPEQRCWVERQQVQENHGGANVPGAIVGAVIGGVLGHQVGGGRGQDIATAGGAVAGAAVGANVGRGGTSTSTQDVRRCETVANAGPPDYWDVGYNFRGLDHRVQLSAPPGPTITVNGNGEPRG